MRYRALTQWSLDFFSGGPYRFLVLLLFGAAVMGCALYEIRTDPSSQDNVKAIWIAGGCFIVYFGGAYWYATLIYRGRWQAFWEKMQSSLDKFDDLPR